MGGLGCWTLPGGGVSFAQQKAGLDIFFEGFLADFGWIWLGGGWLGGWRFGTQMPYSIAKLPRKKAFDRFWLK